MFCTGRRAIDENEAASCFCRFRRQTQMLLKALDGADICKRYFPGLSEVAKMSEFEFPTGTRVRHLEFEEKDGGKRKILGFP